MKKVLVFVLAVGLLLSGCTCNEQPLHEENDINDTEGAYDTDFSESESIHDGIVDEEYRAEYLKGRGYADSGRSEPSYINVIGYVVVSSTEEYVIRNTDMFDNTALWIIPTYEKDKQYWNATSRYINHKTEVVVREQFLHHEGHGAYSGYLLVEQTADGNQYYIDVSNFITKPYWEYTSDLGDAASVGYFVAEYHQESDYYPMFNDGSKATVKDGKIVLVTRKSTLSTSYPDWNGVEAVVWDDWRLGYGDVTVHFNTSDLTIVY